MAKQLGHSTKLSVYDSVNDIFTEILQANTSGFNRSEDSIDVTTYDSPDRYREFLSGLKDGGEFTVTVVYDGIEDLEDLSVNGQYVLDKLFDSGEKGLFEIKRRFGNFLTVFEFEAIVIGESLTIPLDDVISKEYTIKISGEVGIGSMPMVGG